MGDWADCEAERTGLAFRGEREAMQPTGRCDHGFLTRLCVVEDCWNWDGAEATDEKAPRERGQIRCKSCGEQKPRRMYYLTSSAKPRRICIDCYKAKQNTWVKRKRSERR